MELSQVQGLQGQHPGLRGLEGQHFGHRGLVVVLRRCRNALRRLNRHNLKKRINYAQIMQFMQFMQTLALLCNLCILCN